MKEYFIYIVTNINKSVLYTGVTNDLTKRLNEHKEGANKNAFSSKYKAYHLLYYERFADVTQAICREKEIKAWRREKKIKLIETLNPYWKFLTEEEV